MTLTHDLIIQRLTEQFSDYSLQFDAPFGMLSCEAPREINLKILQFLRDDPEMGFTFLTDLTGVHYPDMKGAELAVVYHLHNFRQNIRMRLRVHAPVEDPKIFTATKIFAGANWMERETYDFFGIDFIGHPNLIRILNVEEMDYFPMRKEYPLEDDTQVDKDREMFGR